MTDGIDEVMRKGSHDLALQACRGSDGQLAMVIVAYMQPGRDAGGDRASVRVAAVGVALPSHFANLAAAAIAEAERSVDAVMRDAGIDPRAVDETMIGVLDIYRRRGHHSEITIRSAEI